MLLSRHQLMLISPCKFPLLTRFRKAQMVEIVNPLKNWALYVFFGANVPEDEVREAAIRNLLQMATVGSSEDVAVAAQLHLPGKWAYRYVMPKRPPGSDPHVI